MIYAGIDVTLQTHPRAIAAGFDAMGLWLWGMLYAQNHQTDGRLHRPAVLTAWGGRRNILLAKKLVEVGLWTEDEAGDWFIHNYSEKNQTSEDIRRKRDAAKQRQAKFRDQKCNALLTPARNALVTPARNATNNTTQDNTTPDIFMTDLIPVAPPSEPKRRRGRPSRPDTACPPSDADAATVAAWCETWKIPATDPLVPQFLAWHQSRDKRWKDWLAAWRNWKANETKWVRSNGRHHVQSAVDRAWTIPEEIT